MNASKLRYRVNKLGIPYGRKGKIHGDGRLTDIGSKPALRSE
jgi:hypothetical protein